MNKLYKAIGLMSGTSCDGIDVALIETDGNIIVNSKGFIGFDYSPEEKQQIKSCYGMKEDDDNHRVAEMEKMLTLHHAKAVKDFLQQNNLSPADIDVIGFHGQTIFHDPANKFTWQVGDGDLLAKETGIDVVYDFRSDDVKAGGQGAPLAPVYHQAITALIDKPVAVLNIGGVANITYISMDNDPIAFDTGPGGALMDDIMLQRAGKPYDPNGETASKGTVQTNILNEFLQHPYFLKSPPKSLDRDTFADIYKAILNLSTENAMATLNAFTVETIALSIKHMPEKPKMCLVSGGGRKNTFLMQHIQKRTGVPVQTMDAFGWNGDAIEAEAFAYMAVRKLLDLPISFPKTTGCPKPMTGGKIVKK